MAFSVSACVTAQALAAAPDSSVSLRGEQSSIWYRPARRNPQPHVAVAVALVLSPLHTFPSLRMSPHNTSPRRCLLEGKFPAASVKPVLTLADKRAEVIHKITGATQCRRGLPCASKSAPKDK